MRDDDRQNEPSPQPTASRRARFSIQRKLVLWSLLLVTLPTIGSAYWLSTIARQELGKQHSRNVERLARSVAGALANHVDQPDHPNARSMLDALAIDPRFAFVVVTDTQSNPTHRRAADFAAYSRFEAWMNKTGRNLTSQVDRRLELTEDGSLIARIVPVWNPPLAAGGQRLSDRRELQGYVIVALRDRNVPQVLASLQAMQLGAACLVCLLCLPVILWACRRWTRPLRRLTRATIALSRGERIDPVPVIHEDELGQLTRSFNQMTEKLTRAQQELEAINRDLERKVQDRTYELKKSNQQLERAIDDRNQFLRAVSHDLGAPLRNISGMSGMLLMKYKDVLADDALNKIERISANAKMQADLLGELLELSRIRTTQGKREWVDLDKLIHELGDSLAYDLEHARIELKVLPGLPVIYAERNRMRQVFQNLLDNAVKYMLDQPVRQITVGHEDNEAGLTFFVADTGPGMPKEEHERIFEVFRRGRQPSEKKVAGRGVGLAGVKSIVETYQGRVWVRSEVGEGSTFYFTLDRASVLPESSAQAAEMAARAAG